MMRIRIFTPHRIAIAVTFLRRAFSACSRRQPSDFAAPRPPASREMPQPLSALIFFLSPLSPSAERALQQRCQQQKKTPPPSACSAQTMIGAAPALSWR